MIKRVTRDEYFKIDALSQSDLSWMLKSPRHFKMKDKLRKETDAMRMGTLLHLAVLEPKRFREVYETEPTHINGEVVNRRVKAHREYLEKFRQDNLDKVIVSNDNMDHLIGMLGAVGENKELRPLLEGGQAEIAATWEYKGLKCKGLADYLIEHPKYGRTIVDIKKTQDASPSGFAKSIYNYNYFIQAAWYLRGFEANEFIFVAIEDKAPYSIGIYKADPSLIEYGMKQVDRLTDMLLECQKNDMWPSYTNGVDNILLPSWVAGQPENEGIYGQ